VSRLTDLIARTKAKDPQLAADLEREFRALSSRLSFGLNFERHTPESVELPGRPIRRGDKVRILPPRGSTAKGGQSLWVIKTISADRKHADLELLDRPDASAASASPPEQTKTTAPLADLIVVAEFRDVIYPGLVSTGKVSRGGAQPWHTVINGENYHVLKALTWTHRGKIDAIYIDPPYNTGARDWKYNNDYVEADDQYRHSKWLAMMERRLLIAKELLNPADSVLIVTIDEKEYLRLGLLLEQTFLNAKIQMISSVIKPGGTSRTKEFSRVEEYLYFVFIGGAELARTSDSMLDTVDDGQKKGLSESDLWEGMVRRGRGVVRSVRPKQFYPIYIDANAGRIVRAGDALPLGVDRSMIKVDDGLTAVWPIKDDGTEGFWQLSPSGLAAARNKGTVRVGTFNEKTGQWRIQYMKAKKAKAVTSGLVATLGKDEHGVVILDLKKSSLEKESTPRTVWNKASHDASTGGAGLLNKLLDGRRFPFPKSLYAVEDSLRFFVKSKPNAIMLDFFAGSGTTAHAVARLNKQDGGSRQCISVTNNEVAPDEEKALREKKLRPGDPEWERCGICDYITKPRVVAAITGKTPDGEPIKGDYKFTDEFPMADGFEANAEFFTLTYETPVAVSYQTAFARIAPLLWLRAGSVGRRIDKVPAAGWEVVDTYGLLVDLDKATDFLKAVRKAEGLRIAYIVTDDERRFQSIARRLPDGVEPTRLYESYLTNFAFANGIYA
jgi:adenine-specific DNA-methyltransferase